MEEFEMNENNNPTVGVAEGDAVAEALQAPEVTIVKRVRPPKPKEWNPGYWVECQNFFSDFGLKADCSGWKKADALQCKKCLDLLKAEAGYKVSPNGNDAHAHKVSPNGNGNGAHKPGKTQEELKKVWEGAWKVFGIIYRFLEEAAVEDESVAIEMEGMLSFKDAALNQKVEDQDLYGAIGTMSKAIEVGNKIQLRVLLERISNLARTSSRDVEAKIAVATDEKVELKDRCKAGREALAIHRNDVSRQERRDYEERSLAAIAGVEIEVVRDRRYSTERRLEAHPFGDGQKGPATFDQFEDGEGDADYVPTGNGNAAADATLKAMQAGTLKVAPAGKPPTQKELARLLAEAGIAEVEVEEPVKVKPQRQGRRGHRRNGNSPEED